MINRGKVPLGYKKNQISVIPSDWKTASFERIADVQSGLVDPKKEPYVNMIHIGPENIEKDSGRIINTETAGSQGLISGKYEFDRNSIIYSKVRPNLNKVCIPDYYGICSADCYAVHVKKGILKEYLYTFMLSDLFLKQAISCSMRTKMPKVNQNELSKFKVILPNEKEQLLIVNILKLYDIKINCLKDLILVKKKYQQSLIQKLITGKYRLPGFNKEWIKIKIKNIIDELSEKTASNNEYEILSVTKNGILKQSEHFNKQIASDDNTGYKILRRDNLVFSTMNLWMGSLDVLEKYDVGIVSPAYKIFDFNKNFMIPSFGKFYMKSSHMIWIYNINSEQGASVVRKNLDMEGLMNTNIKIPPIDEQTAISKILSIAGTEIELIEKKLEQTKLEKKAMMQLLLSGIVRVN